MQDAFAQRVYDTLQGNLTDEACIPEIESLYTDGSLCDRMYEDILAAYSRLLGRLGSKNEDPDLEIIMNAFLSICRETGLWMYRYGVKFGME